MAGDTALHHDLFNNAMCFAGLFKDSDLLLLVNSLQALCSTPGCRLRDLAMAVNYLTPVDAVVEACPSVTSLSLDIFPPSPGSCNKLVPKRALKCAEITGKASDLMVMRFRLHEFYISHHLFVQNAFYICLSCGCLP